MQLQIECNSMPGKQNSCVICNTLFVMQEARVIVCNDLGYTYGEVCPICLHRGMNWLSERFNLAMPTAASST
ncbi:hypothetical protein IQ238_08155 [Pleurocapsales cyanobacterium LEGE 06147]|nr:hypothetical protein [Pleurocapsales cyanobacterium LEGE 06147]